MMPSPNPRYSRRNFLAQAAALTLAGGVSRSAGASPTSAASKTGGRQSLAVLTSVYRPLSEAYHLVGRFLHGYRQANSLHLPSQFVRSLYVDQHPDNDLSKEIAREFDIQLADNVSDALTLGGDQLAVEGVLLIVEHGNYPRNDRGQVLYPRHEMLEQVVAVFRKTGRSVPVFVSRHLSYSWARAKQMVRWSQDLDFPLLAGSSIPMTWRQPELSLPLESRLSEGLITGHGSLETAGSVGLEALQTMMERGPQGNMAVRQVTCLTGPDVWKAAEAGRWDPGLLEAALGCSETVNPGDVRRNTGSMPVGNTPRTPPIAFLVEYRDGRRGTVLLLNGHVADFCFAGRIDDQPEPVSCLFLMPSAPGARHYDCLAASLEQLFQERQVAWPVGRNLLVTGMLAAAMESHARHGVTIATPDLDVSSAVPVEEQFCRGRPS